MITWTNSKALMQMLQETLWPDLDYLVLDIRRHRWGHFWIDAGAEHCR
ncbi:hypothetical protein ACNKHX_13090 [Shigella flexneri]